MKKILLCLCTVYLTAAEQPNLTTEQANYLLAQALQPTINNDALKGNTRTGKELGVPKELFGGGCSQEFLGTSNAVEKRFKVVYRILISSPLEIDASILEDPRSPLEACIAYMRYLQCNQQRPKLDVFILNRFPMGADNTPVGMFMPDVDVVAVQNLRHYDQFFKWYQGNLSYHCVFTCFDKMKQSLGMVFSNTSTYYYLLGRQKHQALSHIQKACLPLAMQAHGLHPTYLPVFRQLSQYYTLLGDAENATSWKKKGDVLANKMHNTTLDHYVKNTSDVAVASINPLKPSYENTQERLIRVRLLLNNPARLQPKKRFSLLISVIIDSPDREEVDKALEEINVLLLPELFAVLLSENDTTPFLNILQCAKKCGTKGLQACQEIRRKIHNGLIALKDRKLAFRCAGTLELAETLDVLANYELKATGQELDYPYYLESEKSLKIGEVILANALSLEPLEGKSLRELMLRLKKFEEAGLKKGDVAYDNTLNAIREIETQIKEKREADQQAACEAHVQYWAHVPLAFSTGKAKSHRTGAAHCDTDSESDEDSVDAASEEGVFSMLDLKNEAKRRSKLKLSEDKQALLNNVDIDFFEAEGARICAVLRDVLNVKLHAWTFHGNHGENAENLTAERKAEIKRLCFERYNLINERQQNKE